jgi:hypothetical protein
VDPKAKWAKVDLDLAQRAARRASRSPAEKDGGVLDTLARVWFLRGERRERRSMIETRRSRSR